MTAEDSPRGVLVHWPTGPECMQNMMGEPAYALIAHSSDPNKGRGEEYNVEVYISGNGDVDELLGEPGYAAAKLYVSIPAYLPETIKREPNGLRLSVKSKYTEYTEIKSPIAFKGILSKGLHTNTFDLTIPIYFFNRRFLDTNPHNLSVEGERIIWDKQWWQDSDYYYAPFSFSFTVANNAPSGDHNIYLHLVYRDCLKWYSNSATLKIHIRQWYETDWIQIFVVIAALATMISAWCDLSTL
jgi:hypothetical protein